MPDDVVVRNAVATDEPFIKRMLYVASNAPGRPWPSYAESMAEPRNQRFWRGFGAAGDVGVVAERAGRPIGAAWVRRFDSESPADERVLAIGVAEDERGRGVGQMLMDALLVAAQQVGISAITLTVGASNDAALRLYSTRGFEVVSAAQSPIRMRRELR